VTGCDRLVYVLFRPIGMNGAVAEGVEGCEIRPEWRYLKWGEIEQ
jgi:hypothetical protein